jgi:hypothetical protein
MATERDEQLMNDMRASFEASLPHRLTRAVRVQLQNIIPAHWFAAAASECAGMYVSGFFYGAISIAQAYVEALTRFLADHHRTKVQSDPAERCRYLNREGLLTEQAMTAALAILSDRNDFHHLNRSVEQDYEKLQARAADCVNQLHTIESQVFEYSFGPEPGKLALKKPEYWPSGGPGLAQVNLRQLW